MAESQYFRLTMDMYTGGRRAFASFALEEHLASLDALQREGRWEGPAPRIEVTQGWLPDWNLISPSSVPLVSRRAADVIAAVARPAVQRIPVTLSGVEGEWEVLGVRTVDCGEGNPRDIMKAVSPVIDPARAADGTLFRLPHLVLIARRELRDAFEAHAITGAEFKAAATTT